MTERLRARDLRTVLDVAGTIAAADDLPEYRATVLALAPRLVEGDVYGYNEVPPRRAQPLIQMSATPDSSAWKAALVRLAEEHPLVLHYLATGDPEACAISDLMSRRAFEGSEFYRDVLSYAAGRDQLAVSMPGRDGLVIGLAVNRERRGFSARDHAMYGAIRPFLVHGYRKAIARRRERAVAAALSAAADATARSVVLVDRAQRIEHATPGAAKLLGTERLAVGDLLPPAIARWLRAQRGRPRPEPFVTSDVVARLVAGGPEDLEAIVVSAPRGLTPARLRTLGLTPREADVLALVATGLGNTEVARRLGIGERTVAKHLQHVNDKLGTGSRTAAVARATELLPGES